MSVVLATEEPPQDVPGGQAACVAASATEADELRLLRSENAELRALLAMQGDLAQGSTPKEILQEIVGQVRAALGCNRCYALLWDAERRRFEPAAVTGLGNEAVAALKGFVLGPRAVPALDRAFYADRPFQIEDATCSPLIPTGMAQALGMGALLLAPIRGVGNETIGVILLDFDRPGTPGDDRQAGRVARSTSPLTPERLQLAGAVTGQLTLLLENATLYEQSRRRSNRLEALNEIGLLLAAHASDETGTLFAQLHPRVAEVVDGSAYLLALLDDRGSTMTVWGAFDGDLLPPQQLATTADDALSLTLRGGRQATFATRAELEKAGALPPQLFAAFADAIAPPASAIYLPLRLRRRTFGALVSLSPQAHAYTQGHIEFLTTIAAQLAVTIEHSRLYAVLRAKGEVRRRLLDQTLQAQENERKNLVDGILDGALQELASCSYRLDLCIRLSELERHDRSREELRQTREQLASRIEALRTMVASLRPSNLDLLGLQSALRDELAALQAQTGMQARFRSEFTERLDGAIETRAYRIVQELLNNVRRHAGATAVTVELRDDDRSGQVILSVIDDGHGFDADDALHYNRGMGLHGIREQAESLGGGVRFQSRPGVGTRVEVILPRVMKQAVAGREERDSRA